MMTTLAQTLPVSTAPNSAASDPFTMIVVGLFGLVFIVSIVWTIASLGQDKRKVAQMRALQQGHQ